MHCHGQGPPTHLIAYAAVQAVEGVRHTRGTPPAVGGTAAETRLDLARGGVPFADAQRAGRLRARGGRADPTGYLPLLEGS